MIEIICGEKGKGKTKELLEKVNLTDEEEKYLRELKNKEV